jgi:PAS domain S-box-containing protein
MLKIANVNELNGKTDFDLSWKKEALAIQKTDQEVINSNKTIELEEFLTLANGQHVIMLTRKTPLQDQEGNVVAILGVAFDISIQKKTDNKIQQPAQINLDNIITDLPGHVYWKDKNGVYLGCNKRQAQSLGFQSSLEVIGKTDFDLPLKKEDASLIRQNDLKIMETGQTESIEETAQMDGRDVVVLSQKSPLRNEFREIAGIIGISLDITSRKIEEENSRREKENAEFALAYVIEHLPGHIYWKNKDSVYQGCNLAQAKSAGFSEVSEMVGKTDYEMPWSNEADILRQSDLMVMSTMQELTREELSKVANSEEVSTFLSRKVPFLNKKGELIGVLGISFDITDRKKMEAALREAIKIAEAAKEKAEASQYIMTEFVSNMGHDIATPISDMGSVAQILSIQGDDYPEFKDLFDILIERCEACNTVRQRIINATSVANLEVNPEKFSISRLLLELEKELRPTIGTKNIRLIINPLNPLKGDWIITDRSKLYDILYELMSNALKFTEEGQVSVSVSKEGDRIHFKIADTGIGIPADKLDYIFEQYTKIDRSNKFGATFKGVGAGLYLVKILAKLLGGTIHVESEVNKGSTFTLSLPVCFKKD